MTTVTGPSDLYGLPLDEFTTEREQLVKRLKADGERDQAASASKLRKPTVAAWAVNQLVRTQSKEIKALFRAGDAAAKAQTKGQADALRKAGGEMREQLVTLIGRAEGLLDSGGHPPSATVLERVSETLRAAAIDSESREQVQDGCLTRELRYTGLGGI